MAAGARQDGIDRVPGDAEGESGQSDLSANEAEERKGRSSAEEWLPAGLVPYDHEADEQAPDPEPAAEVEPEAEPEAVEPEDDRSAEAEAEAREANVARG